MMDDEISSSPPLWRKILHGILDDLLNSLGYPATLRRRLNNGILPVSHPQLRNTFWLRSVVCWQTWLEYEKHCIRYLRLGHDGDYDYLQRHIPQLDGLINSETSESFCCDITAVGGLSASSDCDQELSSLDAFAQQCCQELAIPLTRDRLNRNLSPHGLRLSEMVFSQFTWMPARLYWNNVDGAHHFAAARFLATQLSQPVSLTGQLNTYSINPQKIRQLTAQWDLFLVPEGIVYGEFKDALLRLKCPFGVSNPPHWENGDEQHFRVIWLERHQTAPARVSRPLAQAGFPSLSQQLSELK